MRKRFTILLLFISYVGISQRAGTPKIVIGIVVDQMRQDYLYRFSNKYSEGGFKRMMKAGYHYKNAHYNYAPTYTAPGHAAVYTGTTPSNNGIIANSWYSREKNRNIYCVSDLDVSAVGGTARNGKVSPKNLKVSTITDELRLSSNFRSKVVSISIKDRGAVLPAGHNPTGTYWFDSATGRFMSSTYYTGQLSQWVDHFNQRGLVAKYLDQTWATLLPIAQYTESTVDNVPYEKPPKGRETPTFPYLLKQLTKDNGAGLIRTTPYGNTLVMDMALAAVEGEQLGVDAFTDFLAVSLSSTDYVGHAFGPNSIELQDTYLRLDLEIKRLLDYMDTHFKDSYMVFLTADHGVANVPLFMEVSNLTGGYSNEEKISRHLRESLVAELGKGAWITSFSNDQVFLNRKLIEEKGMSFREVQEAVKGISLHIPEVAEVFTAYELSQRNGTSHSRILLENGFNAKISGDVIIRFQAGYIDGTYGTPGTTHGSSYNYDTNVPMLFLGKNIPAGESVRKVSITDIAPTLSMMLSISLPNAATGDPLTELFE